MPCLRNCTVRREIGQLYLIADNNSDDQTKKNMIFTDTCYDVSVSNFHNYSVSIFNSNKSMES